MNSLNIISARVSPPPSPSPSRSNSLSSLAIDGTANSKSTTRRTRRDVTDSDDDDTADTTTRTNNYVNDEDVFDNSERGKRRDHTDEATSLLEGAKTTKDAGPRPSSWRRLPRRLATAILDSIQWVLSTIAAPGVFIISCFYDEDGKLAPIQQVTRLFTRKKARKSPLKAQQYEDEKAKLLGEQRDTFSGTVRKHAVSSRPDLSSYSSSTGPSSESESDSRDESMSRGGQAGGIEPSRRSIRIKLNNEEAMRHRRTRKSQSQSQSHSSSSNNTKGSISRTSSSSTTTGTTPPKDVAAQLKSPTSPAGALTRYPRTPGPPRPLIPRRMPSYTNLAEGSINPHQKTLVLDLDETLIHSLSKGGRMSTGHMVEVRLTTTYVGVGGQASVGPQHPILYYVHKRPHCDDFLRRVCKWYNLVVFTASVQEYADPVIDWLESERKYFSARYYRQHCTFRHGAFIKDLSSVEPDLSRVMILDNSPLSYMFHQDNAIPIQGWISDPTDNDLQHIVPLLEGLQYVSDVRAFLALRGGEDGQHLA